MLPVESIPGKLPVVPVGPTGTIPFSMRRQGHDFVGVAFDSSERCRKLGGGVPAAPSGPQSCKRRPCGPGGCSGVAHAPAPAGP